MDTLRIPDPRHGYGTTVPEPRLYALLAVEVKPGFIAYYHLELDHTPGACTIEATREDDPVHVADMLDPLRYQTPGPTRITATISGTVVSDRPDYRPPARTPSRIDESALSGHTRPLPLPAGGDR